MKFNLLDLLLPRETKFYNFLNEQVDIFVKGCGIFNELLSNIERLDESEIKRKLFDIKECEQKGDNMEHMIIEELHKTFITPIDREDIHLIVINVDKSLDILNSISRKIEIYGITSAPPNVCKFSEIIVEIAAELKLLIGSLKSKENINETIRKMHMLENRSDDLFHTSMADLFRGKYNPVDIIRFKEMYEHMESVVDSVDYVGKIVRGVMVKLG